MKKKSTKKIISPIGKFIDKFLVAPITKFFLLISKLFNKNGKHFEKWITKTSTLIFISLILALVTFFFVDIKSMSISDTSAEVVYNQPVSYEYNHEAYVVEGLPETVDITMIGRSSDLYLAKQLSTYNIKIDMSKLKAGTHKVDLKHNVPLASIDYKLDPSSVTVVIYPKESMTKTLAIDTLNSDMLDQKLYINSINTDITDVTIKGARHVIDKVATVKALLDVKEIPNPSVGKINMKDIPLLAYDDRGNIIDIEIVPNKVNAELEITSPSKEVPIKVIPKGTVTAGLAISSISTSINKVTVYGDQEVLNTLSFIPVEIDVTGIKENKKYSETIKKPNGVTFFNETSINIDVSVDKESAVEIPNIRINPENLDSGLSIQAASQNDNTVTVIAKGVESVIKNIDPSTIKATIDLSGYKAGTHEVEVKVEGTDSKVTYQSKTTKVKVIIE